MKKSIYLSNKNRWMDGIIEWLKKTYAADHPEYYPPTETSNYQQDENLDEPTSTTTPTEVVPSPTPTLTPTLTP